MHDISQWIAFDLGEKGFNVRVAVSDRKKAIDIYGLPGNNVDIVELNNFTSEELYARAVEDAQAVVICSAFEPAGGGIFSGLGDRKIELNVAERVLDIAVQANIAKVGTIKKVLYMSRYIPQQFITPASNGGPLDFIFGGIGSGSITGGQYDNFRSIHYEFEDIIRGLKTQDIEYAIVRAPPVVDVTREGGSTPLMLLQEE